MQTESRVWMCFWSMTVQAAELGQGLSVFQLLTQPLLLLVLPFHVTYSCF